MSLLLEKIEFTQNECLRLLRWQGNAQTLESLEANGRTLQKTGLGGRWHSHGEMELTLFTRGSGRRYVGDHAGTFDHTDCVLLGSHLPHCWTESGPTDGYVLQFHLPIEHPLQHLGGGKELQILFTAAKLGLKFSPSTTNKALSLIERIAKTNKLARAGLLLELLSLLCSSIKNSSTALSKTSFVSFTDSNNRTRIESVVQWILEDFTNPLSLNEAIQRSAMSRATLCRQFHRHTGKTFTSFVTSVRLTHAHQLLTQTKHSISEVAYVSGFGSLTQFNASFRKQYNMAPRELRKTLASL
ncbi:MAG: AraC family transcriptional regulator [Verrucomicrobiales bacterium]|nr:AraC family transcriptional regulator [Verrucomicrobiales bacterium]